jgi:hypothetical protein
MALARFGQRTGAKSDLLTYECPPCGNVLTVPIRAMASSFAAESKRIKY